MLTKSSKSINISFVVLTYNRSDALLQVLKSLAKQCTENHEVIIADDGSSAESFNFIKTVLPHFQCKVRHVWHPDLGFTASRARNLGAVTSQGAYLVFLDGDCIPGEKFVRAHEALARRGCFVNGNRVLLSEKLTARILSSEIELSKVRITDWVMWRLRGDINKLAHLLFWPSAPWRINSKFRWKQIRSCNFAVWKSDFEKVNGFDETFEGWGHEDADLVLRLHNLGLVRKNGFFCTEVYHLWHRQNSRVHESENYRRVIGRVQSGLVFASKGFLESMRSSDAVVTALN